MFVCVELKVDSVFEKEVLQFVQFVLVSSSHDRVVLCAVVSVVAAAVHGPVGHSHNQRMLVSRLFGIGFGEIVNKPVILGLQIEISELEFGLTKLTVYKYDFKKLIDDKEFLSKESVLFRQKKT